MPCLSTGRNRGRRYGPFLHLFQCCVFSLFSLFSNSWGDRRFLPSNSRALYSPQIWNRFLSSHSFFFFLAGEISLAIRTLCRFDDTGDSPPPTWLVLSMNDGKFLPRRAEQTLMSVQHSFPPCLLRLLSNRTSFPSAKRNPVFSPIVQLQDLDSITVEDGGRGGL